MVLPGNVFFRIRSVGLKFRGFNSIIAIILGKIGCVEHNTATVYTTFWCRSRTDAILFSYSGEKRHLFLVE